MRARYILPAALAVVLGTACESDEPEPAEPAERPAATVSQDDIDILAMDATWVTFKDEVCPPIMDLLDMGLPPQTVYEFSVREFEDAYGSPLSAAAKNHFISLLRSCP